MKTQEKQLSENITDLEFKNSLLNENIDKDYIEILIREKFIYSKKGEKIYIIKENEKSD